MKNILDGKMVLLSIGSNEGDRLQHLRTAIAELESFLSIQTMSHVIETAAFLPPGAPAAWNLPFLNMVVAADTSCDSFQLLKLLKKIERKLGRDMEAPRWSPRIIDVDILVHGKRNIGTDSLTIPHRELNNRNFIRFLMNEIGYEVESDSKIGIDNYIPLDNFVLFPRLIGILNITPDSFSDGGKFLDPVEAEKQAKKLIQDGAYAIDIGAQSTRPGYEEISPAEEISRLDPVLERCGGIGRISLDTYFDEVVRHVLQNSHAKIEWINDQMATLAADTLKLLADRDIKLVTMLHGTNFSWLEQRVKYLENLGMRRSNIIIDPGIGFGKSRHDNVRIIKRLDELKTFGCKILLGASRKSFIAAHSNAAVMERDLESIAVACFTQLNNSVDYLRVHNVRDHMRFFVTTHCLQYS
ncbi:MAG: dihydropteroate synthase [Holosporaceae bacterium]|jgi:2-amino-4-hydroxy-6-hydroxymethyldihydropteridine diphosphokinase/dihydropteroate synthase|nr:dihydropteroate synthase [Holosporaceae bacterium]